MAVPVPSSSDDADRVQLDLLRSAGIAGRFSRARALSAFVMSLSRKGIRERHPELSEQEVLLRFAELHYGEALAARVREHLERK